MSACPDIEALVGTHDATISAHVASCEACRAVVALAMTRDGRELTCDQVEPMLAAWVVGALDSSAQLVVARHLGGCDACMDLSRALAGPDVSDALFDLGGVPLEDFTELRTVETDNYVRGSEIGRGGMGRIVRARDRRLGRSVAIKELLDERMQERFEHEARLTARLQHPAIVNVHEAGRWPSGEPFYVMKYVAGRPLDQLIAECKTAADRLALLPNLITVVEAIAYAHSERIIHRDLKPQNILVGAFGETVVIDWGLAKDLTEAAPTEPTPYRDGARDLTSAGAGTPIYMPPEQAAGETPDERVDVYALGATLYHVLAGRAPFRGWDLGSLRKSKDRRPEPLLDVDPTLPRDLVDIAHKAMAPDPRARYATAGALGEELRRFTNGQVVSAHAYSLGELGVRFVRRHRAMVTMAAIFLAVLTATGAVSVRRIVMARHEAEAQRDATDRALAEMLVERGRSELVAGAPSRALVFLAEAMRRGADTTSVRHLVAQAARPADALVAVLRAGGAVAEATFSPDGERLVSAGLDGTAVVWDVASGTQVVALPHGSPVSTARFSPDGTRVVTASCEENVQQTHCDRAARVWNARTGVPYLVLTHAAAVRSASYSPDGRSLLTVSGKIATVWDAVDGRRRFELVGHTDAVQAATWRGGEDHIVTAGADGTARIWDATTGALVTRIAADEHGISSAELDAEGARLVTAGWDHKAKIWNARTGELVATTQAALEGPVRTAQFLPDGSVVTQLHGANVVQVWRSTGAPLRTLPRGPFLTAAVYAGAGLIATAGSDDAVRVWDGHGNQVGVYDSARATVHLTFDPAGGHLASVGEDGTVQVWQLATRLGATAPIGRLAGPADGDKLVVTTGINDLSVIDVRTEQTVMPLPAGFMECAASSPSAGAVEADGRHVLVVTCDGFLRRWDLSTGFAEIVAAVLRDPASRRPGRQFDSAILSRHGERILMRYRGYAPTVLFDAQGRELAQHAPLERTTVFDESARLVAATAAGAIELLDADRLQVVRPLEKAPSDLYRALAFSPDGSLVAALGRSGALRVWRVSDGKLVVDVFSAAGKRGLVFSRDGRSVLTFGASELELRDVASGNLLVLFRGHHGDVVSASFSHDGTMLISAAGDGTALVWDVASGLPLEEIIGVDRDTVGFSASDEHAYAGATVWPVGADRRSAAEIQALAERTPFVLRKSSLVARERGWLVDPSGGPRAAERTRTPRHGHPLCPEGTTAEGNPFPEGLALRCTYPDGTLALEERWWPTGVKMLRASPADGEQRWDAAGRLVERLEHDLTGDGLSMNNVRRRHRPLEGATVTDYGPSGLPVLRADYNYVVFDGRYETWYANGQPKEVGRFACANGHQEGEFTEYYADGRKAAQGTMIPISMYGLRRIGDWTLWDPQGQATVDHTGFEEAMIGPDPTCSSHP